MRTRPKKHIRVPITSRAGTDGGRLRTILLAFAVLIACGLLYAYVTRPDLFSQLTHIELGKMNTIGAPPRL
jgi:hypothetical protein